MISLENKDFDDCPKLSKNVGDLGKLLPKALKSGPKPNKSPYLVTLLEQSTVQDTIAQYWCLKTARGSNILRGPPRLLLCHQRAVHIRKKSYIVLNTTIYFVLNCNVLALLSF